MPDVTSLVFIVDDDVSVRESLELLIRTAGWQPETFGSAQEFLSRPRATVPCCLVLDVTLPGVSGLELQEQLTTTENQISFARQHYNASVLDYNTSIATFPNVLIAGPFNFDRREFFDAEPEASRTPRVDLGFSELDEERATRPAPSTSQGTTPPPPPPSQGPPAGYQPPPPQGPPPGYPPQPPGPPPGYPPTPPPPQR